MRGRLAIRTVVPFYCAAWPKELAVCAADLADRSCCFWKFCICLEPTILLERPPEMKRHCSDAMVDVKMEDAGVKDEDEDEVDPLDAFMAGNDAVGLGFML